MLNTGWIGILAKYFDPDEHPSLYLAAGKALANIDEEFSRKNGVYDPSVYLLYPLNSDKAVSTSFLFLDNGPDIFLYNFFPKSIGNLPRCSSGCRICSRPLGRSRLDLEPT